MATRRDHLEGIRRRVLEAKDRMLQARPELATRDLCDEFVELVGVLLEDVEPAEPEGVECSFCQGGGSVFRGDGSALVCPECDGGGRAET